MNRHIETIRTTRIFLLQFVEQLSTEELNTIPAGFNNNIIWNMGHLVAAQQGVCYKRAGVDMVVEEPFFEMYKPESKPEQTIGLAETERIKQLMMNTLDRLQADYEAGVFSGYTAWVSRYGVNIDNIDDALAFLPFHEGMHLGYIMAMKRVIKG